MALFTEAELMSIYEKKELAKEIKQKESEDSIKDNVNKLADNVNGNFKKNTDKIKQGLDKTKDALNIKKKIEEKKKKDDIEKKFLAPKKKESVKEQVYRSREFEFIMNEFFDITDDLTRKTLLTINEEDQNKVMISLTSKLYDAVVDKADDIDFGDIPGTNGDITKLPNYQKIIDTLDVMRTLLREYKQDTKPIDTIETAIENVKARKDMFEKAFRYKIEMPTLVYNTIVMAIVTSTSYMVSNTVEFIKTPGQDSFTITVDKVGMNKSNTHLLYTNLQKFNNACATGELDKSMDYLIQSKIKNFTGFEIGVLGQGAAIIALVLCIIPILRELIFLFYYSRTRISEYFEIQSEILQMNAYNLEYNKSLDKQEKEKIKNKQLKIADSFKKISNTLAVDMKGAEVKATKEIVKDNKKHKATEVMDELPDSAAVDTTSSLF